ncbi:hypothetical protein SAMN05660236_5070 [Ohtaekwangia koreensis]|uniref:Uncharacterized protein n=1 Tax=Ohtaekwangia koreensis TaxID=688867 RepID=A0A1T5MD20_9BACT|nr:hypothetical protein SAMN05660236_5070 [Ohtaekwangia koreensis]
MGRKNWQSSAKQRNPRQTFRRIKILIYKEKGVMKITPFIFCTLTP